MKTVLASYNSPEMKKAPLKNTTAKTCTSGDGLDYNRLYRSRDNPYSDCGQADALVMPTVIVVALVLNLFTMFLIFTSCYHHSILQ